MIQIDTSAPEYSIRNCLPDWFLDQAHETDTDAQLARAYGYHLIWQMGQRKKLETVRRHFTDAWPALRFIADLQPQVFDEVMCAYAETALRFEHPNVA